MKKYKKSPLKQNTKVTSDAEKAAKDMLGQTAMIKASAKGGTETKTITIGGDREVEKFADPKEFKKQMEAEARAMGFKGTVEDYIKQKEQELGYRPREEQVTTEKPDLKIEEPLYEAQYAQGQPIWEQRQQERSQRASGRRAARLTGKAARIQERLDSAKLSDVQRKKLEEKKKQTERSAQASAKAAENQAKALEAGSGLRGKTQIEDKVVTVGQTSIEEQTAKLKERAERLQSDTENSQENGSGISMKDSAFKMKHAHSPSYMYKNPGSPAKMWGANKTDDSIKLSFNSDAFRANNKSTRPMPKSITKKASGFKMKGYGRQK